MIFVKWSLRVYRLFLFRSFCFWYSYGTQQPWNFYVLTGWSYWCDFVPFGHSSIQFSFYDKKGHPWCNATRWRILVPGLYTCLFCVYLYVCVSIYKCLLCECVCVRARMCEFIGVNMGFAYGDRKTMVQKRLYTALDYADLKFEKLHIERHCTVFFFWFK